MNREKKLESVLVIAAGFIALFLIFKIQWFLLIALTVAFFGAVSKVFTNGLTWIWFKIAEILGWINSRILLSIVFFIFLFPMALIVKCFGKLSINLKKIQQATTQFGNIHMFQKTLKMYGNSL